MVVPDGKGQGRRYTGGEQGDTVDLRWLYEIFEKDSMGMCGGIEVILPSLAGLSGRGIRTKELPALESLKLKV